MITGFGNNTVSALASDITATQTTYSVIPGAGEKFEQLLTTGNVNAGSPHNVYAKLTLTDSQGTVFEICHLTKVTGDSLTVIRGQEGTTAKGWSLNDVVANFATRGSEESFVQIEQLQGGDFTSATAGGTPNALTISLPSTYLNNASSDWALKTPLMITPIATNTGSVTMQVTLAGKVIGTFPAYKGNKAQLESGDLLENMPFICVLDSGKTFFTVINPVKIYSKLGTTAYRDVGTASGNVMEVGAFGLGGNGVTVSDANTIDKSGIYRLTVDGIHGPAVQAAAEIIHIQYDGASANQIGWIAGVGNGKMYHRARAGSVFGGWLPLVDPNGGTLKGDNALLVLQNTAAAADKKALYIRGLNSDGSMRWYVGNGSAGNDSVQLSDYTSGAQLQLAETCTINKPLKVTGNFDTTGSGNFPGGVAAAGGITLNSSSPVGMYFGSDGTSFTAANMLLKSWYGIGFYNTCTSTGIQGITGYINVRTGNMSMRSTITPGDYSNFDARYGLKTAVVTDCRQTGLTWSNAIGTYGSSYTVPAGCVVVGARNNGSSDVSHMGLAYVSEQVLINGTWKTIGRA